MCAGDVVHVQTMADTGRSRAADTDLTVSAKTGAGLDAIRRCIADRLAERAVSLAGQTLALQSRHTDALRAARESIDRAARSFDPEAHALVSPELVAMEMRAALDALGRVGGQMSPDDVIGRVFATFCVGK